jgi:hypothetical protein
MPDGRTDRTKKVLKYVLIGLLVTLFVAPLVVLPLRARAIRGEESPCRPPVEKAPVAIPETAAPIASKKGKGRGGKGKAEQPERPTLNLREDEATTLSFGRSLETKRLDVWLDVSPAGLPNPRKRLKLVVGDFRRPDDARVSPRFLTANSRMIGNQVRLRVCLERELPGDIDPGTYTGRITFFDRRVEPYTLPLTITLAYPVWPWPTLLLYLIVLVALVYVWTIKDPPGEKEVFVGVGKAKEFGNWLRTWPGVMSVGAGLAGAVTAFVATYYNSPDWGSSIAQAFGLIGATFTAFVTAATAVARGRGRDDEETTRKKTTAKKPNP